MRKLASLSIALVGFWVLTYVPGLLTNLVNATPFDGTGDALFAVSMLFPALAAVLLGLLLISNRNRLASQLFDDDELDLGVPAHDLVRVGLVVLGVWFVSIAVLSAFSTGVFIFGRLIRERASLGDIPYLSDVTTLDWLPSLLGDAVRLAAGLFLIVRADAISRRLWFGRPVPSHAASDLPQCPECETPYDPEDYVGGTSPARCVECGAELPVPSHLTSASS